MTDFPKMEGLIRDKEGKQEDLKRLTTPLNAPVYSCSDSQPAEAETFKFTAEHKGRKLFINVICSNEETAGEDIVEDTLSLHIKAGALGYPYNFLLNLKTRGESFSDESAEKIIIKRTAYTDQYIGFPIDCYYEAKINGKQNSRF